MASGSEVGTGGIEFVPHSRSDGSQSPSSFFELKCPVCFELLVKDPQLVSCCGHHFCGDCLKKLRRKPCPLCKETFQSIPDKGHKRQLQSLRVYCLKRSEGCAWEGELRLLESHMSDSGDCQFSKGSCPLGCGRLVSRALMEDHEKNECLKRLLTCSICSTYSDTADNFTKHQLYCPELVMACPFASCLVTLKRKEMSTHVSACPYNIVKCASNGCSWSGSPRELASHVLKLHGTSSNIPLASDTGDAIKKELKALKNTVAFQDSKIAQLNLKVNNQRATLASQAKTIRKLKDEIQELQDDDFSPDFATHNVVARNFHQLKSSNRSFSSGVLYLTDPPSGYAMELYVYPNGIGSGHGSHVSVFLHIVPGRFDDQVMWPYSGDEVVEVRLFNQSMKSCHGKWFTFGSSSPLEARVRPTVASPQQGVGFEQFISHSQVKKYLHNDSLLFEVSCYTGF